MGNLGRKSQLLYVGNEVLLSKATAELLKRSGYKVRTTTPAHAVHVLREERFSAVVLCATLTSEETDEIVGLVTQTESEIPIVSVHLGLLGDAPNARSTVVVDALNGPDALVNAVQIVINQSAHFVGKAV